MSKENYLKIGKAFQLKNKKDYLIYRTFEIFPGFLSWATLIFLAYLSFSAPFFAAIFIIIFDILWFIRLSYWYLHLAAAFRIMKKIIKVDWLEKLKENPFSKNNWQNIYHLIILPFYKENFVLIKNTLDALANSNYPVKEKFIVVLAGEQRAGKHAENIINKAEDLYKDKFFKFLTTLHPSNIPGELAGKGANATWAGKKAKKIIDDLGLAYENIIVSNFDIDTVVPKNYFSRLTYVYLNTKDRLHTSYQPIPLYTNNIWDAPSLSRIAAFSTTFWMLINQERIEKLKTFSSHSMPFKALVDVGFWKTDIVTEDNIIFFQCFLKYNGNYRTTPLYFPVYMDANIAETTLKTIVNIYKQHRRWGWGVETIPYMIYGFIKNKMIPFKKKINLAFEYIESFWAWATNSIIIALFGWLPIAVGGKEFQKTVLAYNLPDITGTILNVALLFLIFSMFFSISLLPPRPPKYKKTKFFWMAVQWILTPFILIFLIVIPALDAQTRLLFGKYMGFWVTPKIRK